MGIHVARTGLPRGAARHVGRGLLQDLLDATPVQRRVGLQHQGDDARHVRRGHGRARLAAVVDRVGGADLLEHATEGDDGSHDLAHIHRVFKNALKIQAGEGGDAEILAAAVLLHDCVAVEKSSPLRSQASRLAAEKASGILAGLGWPEAKIAAVAHAILTHSFSANIPPETLEAKMLQDADRLDAIGMVGVVIDVLIRKLERILLKHRNA